MELFKIQNHLDPTLILDFKIEADCSTVYNAWTDLEIFKKWFCPTGFTVALAEMNVAIGGYFKIHMQSPEGEIYPTKGEYILLDKPNRIVYKDSWDDQRENNEPIVAEIIFEPHSNGTLLKIYSSFATKEQKENVLNSGIVEGWKMFFNNLNTLVQAQ